MNSKSILHIILKIPSLDTYLFFLMLFLFFYNGSLKAQWVQTNGLNNGFITSFVINATGIYAGTRDGVYISTNDGDDWTRAGLANTDVNSIVANGNNIFAGTDTGVCISTNNGTIWNIVSNGISGKKILSLAYNGDYIFACSDLDGVFRSTNNGANWEQVNNGLTSTICYSIFVNSNYIFVGTYHGVFLSTNNGENWSPVGLNKSVSIFSVNATDIYAGTYQHGVYLSTNNGVNWEQIPNGLDTTHFVTSLAIGGTNIFAGTENDGVYISTNKGTIWTQVNTGLTKTDILSLTIKGNQLFTGTYGAGVWKRPLSEFTGISKEENVLPTHYSLSQNYPNPFNPNTIITYSLPTSSNIKLIVYNTLGQTVKVLENGFKNAGNYSVNFNATDLISGIYFYKLEAGQFIQVKKMILLK